VLATLLKPNAGTALMSGVDITSGASTVRSTVGFLAHAPGLYEDLTARENLTFAADMLGLPHTAVDVTLERVGLADATRTRVRGFSAGMQRRLALARLIMRKPSILLLDEPYANLDDDGVVLMNSVIRDIIGSGGAALLALHELAPARGLLDRAITLSGGRIATGDQTTAVTAAAALASV
jgi:heme exporter protein A